MKNFNKLFLYFIFFISFAGFKTAALTSEEFPILKSWATDFTNTLTQQQLGFLNSSLKNYEDTTSNQLVFLMISSLGNYPIAEYAWQVAEQNKIGREGIDNGILLLISKSDRKLRIEVGYGLEGVVPDATANFIIQNEIIPSLKKGMFFEGIVAGLDAIKESIGGEYKMEREIAEEGFNMIPKWILFFFFFIMSSPLLRIFFGRRRRSGVYRRSGWISGGWGSGGGGSSFGGFSGGGGSFGGGGASGSW